jgi:peptidoglycan-associated lipoprotein
MKKIATILLVLASTLIASCTTQQATTQQTTASQIDGDIYIGNETIKYLADGVPDRIFFATNKYNISSKGIETLSKQANYLKSNPNLNVSLEGHADERGTREYNLALGEKRANAVKDYLISNGISSARVNVISYGKEKPVNPASNAIAWSQNRRTVTVKIN